MTSPAYRGVLTIYFDGIVSMLNPYPKPWKFRVQRIFQGWDGEVFAPNYALVQMDGSTNGQTEAAADYPKTSRTIKAMNPAVIIYECLTNRVWGRGLSRNRIDSISFMAAAQKLHAENFGLCLKWSKESEIAEFIQDIIDTIGGVMYTDRTTGLLKLDLIRSDYTFADLPIFEPGSGLLEVSDSPVASPSEMVTECVVTYHDPITDKDRKVKAQNVAVLQALNGAANPISRTYTGVPTPALALRLAQRELRVASATLRRFTLKLDRRGWDITPGSVIRIRSLAHKIPDTAVRIGRFENGTGADGSISVVAVQDVFAMPATSFVGIQPPAWSPPKTTPCLGRQTAFELPYVAVARGLSAANFNALTAGAMFGALIEEGQSVNTNYDIAVRTSAPTSDDAPVDQSYYCGYTP